MKVDGIFLFVISLFACASASAIQWPNDAKAALSISADDGWHSQLTEASLLETYGMRGTFYLTAGGMPIVITDAPYWKQIYLRGHEVANHSYSHWSDDVLAGKTWQQVASDVGDMEWWLLNNIYAMTPVEHTYAYPQGNYVVGSQANAQSVQVGTCEYAAIISGVVNGARIGNANDNIASSVAMRRFFIDGVPIYGDDQTAFNNAKQAIDGSIAKGSWLVLVFHSLGDPGDGYSVSPSAYQQIIQYIDSHRADLYNAPVVTVEKYIMGNIPTNDWTCTLP